MERLKVQGITISVRYIPATDNKPSRVKATDLDGHSVTLCYSKFNDDIEAYYQTAMALAEKMGWEGITWQGGHTKNGAVFVQID